GDYAEGSQFRFTRAGQHLDFGPYGALGKLDEAAAVLGVAAGGGGDGDYSLHAHRVAERTITLERGERLLHRLDRKQSRRLHFATKSAQRLLVEQRGRAAR